MDHVCSYPDCNGECKVSRKTGDKPHYCPWDGKEVPYKRSINMTQPKIEYRTDVHVRSADEVPDGWVLIKALEERETVYKALYFEYLDKDKWVQKKKRWEQDSHIVILSWISISELF